MTYKGQLSPPIPAEGFRHTRSCSVDQAWGNRVRSIRRAARRRASSSLRDRGQPAHRRSYVEGIHRWTDAQMRVDWFRNTYSDSFPTFPSTAYRATFYCVLKRPRSGYFQDMQICRNLSLFVFFRIKLILIIVFMGILSKDRGNNCEKRRQSNDQATVSSRKKPTPLPRDILCEHLCQSSFCFL